MLPRRSLLPKNLVSALTSSKVSGSPAKKDISFLAGKLSASKSSLSTPYSSSSSSSETETDDLPMRKITEKSLSKDQEEKDATQSLVEVESDEKPMEVVEEEKEEKEEKEESESHGEEADQSSLVSLVEKAAVAAVAEAKTSREKIQSILVTKNRGGKGKGLGKGKLGSVRHRNAMTRDNMSRALTKPSLRRLARKGGVKFIAATCFQEMRDTFGEFLKHLMETVVLVVESSSKSRKTVTAMDVRYALRHLSSKYHGTKMYF